MNAVYFSIVLVLRVHQGSSDCLERDLKPDEVCFEDLAFTGPDGEVSRESLVTSLTTCTNVEPTFVYKIWGVHINNHKCVQLYDRQDCMGNSIRITPRSAFANALGAWNFEMRTSSAGICQESCIPNVNQAIENFEQKSINITFYSQEQFNGQAYSYQVRGCTRVTKLNPQTKRYESLQVPKGDCVLAFVGNFSDDVEEPNPCLARDYQSVMELYYGVPALDFFANWHRYPLADPNPLEYLVAVAPCQCNYVRDPDPITIGANLFIILYDEVDFKGEFIQVSMNFTGCKDFASNFQLRSWEGRAASMFVANDTCVQAYKEPNCGDLTYTKFNTSVANLIPHELWKKIRSLSPCTDDYVGDETGENVSESRSSLSNYLIPILSVGGFVCAVLAYFVLYMRRRALRMKSKMREMLSEKEIEDFLHGIQLDGDSANEESERHHEHIETDETSPGPDSKEISFEVLAQNQPYNYELEIPQGDLQFDTKFPIGEGQYGLVFKGTLMRDDKVLQVAIKTTKPFAAVQYLRALLKEVKVMMYVGQHSKIVTLLGCCTANLRKGELLIIMEFCDNGSLESYLKRNRTSFVNLTKNGEINLDEFDPHFKLTVPSDNDGIYCINLQPTSGSPVSKEMKWKTGFNINQLICWSVEIAEGMDYLASKKIIHGDLSARNILLTAGTTAKISDFGLARKLYSYEQYIRNCEDALPWRWLALESLKNMEFSTPSDVWGYGILLWEIFTLGEQPYPGIPFWSTDFIANLEDGLRPSFPSFATEDIYDIMCCCWRKDPKCRPSFFILNSKLQEVKNVCLQKIKVAEYKIIHYV